MVGYTNRKNQRDNYKNPFFIINFLFCRSDFLTNQLDDLIPQASLMQTGEREFVEIIIRNSHLEFEGELTSVSDKEEAIQTSNTKFIDLFWFLKPRVCPSENEQQLDLVTLNLNLNFGNLRINGYRDIAHALHNQALFITKEDLTVNAAIYPAGIFNIRHLRNGLRYRPIEQLFVRYNPEEEPWHDELARTDFQKQNDKLKMTITRGEEKYFYLFEDGQLEMFNSALDFVLTHGFSLVGSRK